MSKDHFAHKAQTFEQNPDRVDNVTNIASAILDKVTLEPSMHLLDFGSGTGLLLERIAQHVGKITAVDISPSMNQQLKDKLEKLPCEVEIRELNLEKQTLADRFDGIISSMTMHHVQDVDAMFRRFHELVKPGGFIAIADLEKEDGSFHTENNGVFHSGFGRQEIISTALEAGFQNVEVGPASVIVKEGRGYPVFLLTASKP
ncbi:MAG TPA: methyltransferase domain-containing protein [Marinobacter sp.]|nr:methyltransferase domain-containing protein [Marinobacter sp.]